MDRSCIGSVDSKSYGKIARLKPKLELVNGAWVSVDPMTFPHEGLVFDHSPDLKVVESAEYLYFRCDLNPIQKERGDSYLVSLNSYDPLLPIYDLSKNTLEEARRRLYSYGLILGINFSSDITTILVELCDGYFVRLKMKWNPDLSHWQGLIEGMSETNNLIDLYDSGSIEKSLIVIDERKYVRSSYVDNLVPKEKIDWSVDYSFFEKVTSKLTKLLSVETIDDDIQVSVKSIKKITAFLQGNEIFPDGFWSEKVSNKQVFNRISEQSKDVLNNLNLIQTVSQRYLEREDVKQTINQDVTLRIDKLAAQKLEQLEQDYRKELMTKLAPINKTLMQKEAELEEVKSKLIKLREEVNVQNQLNQKIQQEIKQFSTSLGRVSAVEYPHAKALADRLSQSWFVQTQETKTFLPSMLPPWVNKIDVSQISSIQPNQLFELLNGQAKRLGIKPEGVELFDGLIRTGELVAIMDNQAEELLQSYATIITGGQIYWLQPDPSTIGLDDLWRVPATQIPTALSLAWHAAVSEPETYHLLCLHKIDMAPYGYWLESLLDLLQSLKRPRNLLVVTTFSRTQLKSNSAHSINKTIGSLVPIAFETIESVAQARLNIAAQEQAYNPTFLPFQRFEVNFEQFRDRKLDAINFRRATNLHRFAPHIASQLPNWPDALVFEKRVELRTGLEQLSAITSQV